MVKELLGLAGWFALILFNGCVIVLIAFGIASLIEFKRLWLRAILLICAGIAGAVFLSKFANWYLSWMNDNVI